MKPLLWPSIARILATFGIFCFHYLGLMHLPNASIDTFAIIIYCLLSGYLINIKNVKPDVWFWKRYLMIMIPYWSVILPIIIINKIDNYKNTLFIDDLITVLGGNLFLENPVYVIAWYITFILLLYLYIYIYIILKSKLNKIILILLGSSYFLYLHCLSFFISFVVGLCMYKYLREDKDVIIGKGAYLSEVLYKIQSYCYPFFLIHGGILMMLYHKFHLEGQNLFLWGLILSSFLAFILYKLSNPVIKLMVRTTMPFITRNIF
jgi:hypothetical protein